MVNREGQAFVYKFDVAPGLVGDINEEYGRDVDVIKRYIFKAETRSYISQPECTLEDELQPPAYRKEVIEMMRLAKKGMKEKYSHNTGLDYYPFQK